MEAVFSLILLGLLALWISPLVLSIVALNRIKELQQRIEMMGHSPAGIPAAEPLPEVQAVNGIPRIEQSTPVSGPTHLVAPAGLHPSTSIHQATETIAAKQEELTPSVQATTAGEAPTPVNPQLELLMGAKGAAFLGIFILVVGISLLIAYAIQQAWLGPTLRCLLGIAAATGLIGLGHWAECHSDKLRMLARVLTGGGGSLLFISIQAAYGMYGLIPFWVAGIGLVAAAASVFALALTYRSQAVAVLGVIGAFLVPVLIGSELGNPTFLLVYVALLNVPVLLLGAARKWQWLYNLAFLGTVIYFLEWWHGTRGSALWQGIIFSLLYFLQYSTLGLYKLLREPEVLARPLDALRLISASALLMGAAYAILNRTPAGDWMGVWFLGYASVHVGLAWVGFRRFPHFTHEIQAFLAGATLFAALALPVQLQGEWISLGWALQGVALASMSRRMGSQLFQTLAVVLGLIGIIKVLGVDANHYDSAPLLFLNLRFWVGLASAGLFGLQGYLLRGSELSQQKHGSADSFWWISFLALLAIGVSDALWTLGSGTLLAWSVIAWILLLVGLGIHLTIPANSSVRILGTWLFWTVPMVLVISSLLLSHRLREIGCFQHGWIWLHLFTLAAIGGFVFREWQKGKQTWEHDKETPSTATDSSQPTGFGLILLSLASGIILISNELMRADARWGSMAVSLFWGLCAVMFILHGLKHHMRALRVFGLILFGLCSAKVLLIDSTQLSGLFRIGAYIGSGALLLFLSLLYQKAAAHFRNPDNKP